MHPTQHTTIPRPPSRRAEPRIMRTHRLITSGSASQGVPCTAEDILDTIRQISATQHTCFVNIYHLGIILGLTEDDRTWLIDAISKLDAASLVMLSPHERPQHLPPSQRDWCVRNASGVPCHEICVAPDSRRIKPVLQEHAPALPVIPKAQDESTHNPRVQQRRISELVARYAAALFSMGDRPHTCLRVLHGEQTSTGRAA